MEQQYFELKPKVKLDEFKIELDEDTIAKLNAYQDHLKAQARKLLKQSPYAIYAVLGTNEFFPTCKKAKEASKRTQASFLDFATNIRFDRNKNIVHETDEHNEQRKVLEAYGQFMKASFQPFLHYVLVYGIKSGHLTSRNLLQYLVDHTWIGKPHITIDLGGNPETSNWVFQIAPSIIEFYKQVLAWGESKYYTPNLYFALIV